MRRRCGSAACLCCGFRQDSTQPATCAGLPPHVGLLLRRLLLLFANSASDAPANLPTVYKLPLQVVLDQLYAEHGEDPSTWPKDVLASLGRRQAELSQQVRP